MMQTTPEIVSKILVFGLAGRIGSGTSFVRDKLQQGLHTFGYEVKIVDVSKTSIEFMYSRLHSDARDLSKVEPYERIKQLQKRGNELSTCLKDF